MSGPEEPERRYVVAMADGDGYLYRSNEAGILWAWSPRQRSATRLTREEAREVVAVEGSGAVALRVVRLVSRRTP